MKVTKAHVAVIVSLESLYPEESHVDRNKYVQKYSKRSLLKIAAGINIFYPSFPYLNYNQREQDELLIYLLSYKDKIENIYNRLSRYAVSCKLSKGEYVIFTRQAHLMVIEQLLQKEDDAEAVDDIDTLDFLKFYLSINSIILKQQDDYSNIEKKEEHNKLSEILSTKVGVINQHESYSYFMQNAVKAVYLVKQLENHPKLGNFYQSYTNNLGVSGKQLILKLWGYSLMFLQKGNEVKIPIVRSENGDPLPVLEQLSGQSSLKAASPVDIPNLRKNPVYKLSNTDYLILAPMLLFEKGFRALINDIWFDHARPAGMIINEFFGEIGIIFEDFVARQVIDSFDFLNHPPPLVGDSLKIDGKELADFYVRQNSKILLGQIKVSAINSRMRYSGEAAQLYKEGKRGVYEMYGLKQMVDSIELLLKEGTKVDSKFKPNKRTEIYPILVHYTYPQTLDS